MQAFLPRTDLLVREVDGETVILDRNAELIHTLNPTASFIWNALKNSASVQDIVQSLVATFDIDPVQATADVTAVLENFRELQLIESS